MISQIESSPLKALLKQIRSRPQMYVGDNGLAGLENLLTGWKLHIKVCDDGDAWAQRFFSDFHDFAAGKFESQQTRGWFYFAQQEAEESERDPFEIFFEWLDEFDAN